MSLAHLFHRFVDGLWVRHLVNGLWAAGGIGAAADLGLDDFGSAWDEPCPAATRGEHTPLEGEPCRACCPSCSSRPLSR